MRVFLTGGTGLIGRRLVEELVARGDQAVVLTRNAAKARSNPALKRAEFVEGDPGARGDWQKAVDGCDGVLNLVGHGVFDHRWTPEIKRKIRESRVHSTRHVAEAIAGAARRPDVLVSASAIGYYGPHGDEVLTEIAPPGRDFLGEVCREWEDAARPVEEAGSRLAIVRVGVVLDRDGGALKAMVPMFRYLPGGAAPIGSGHPFAPARGRQWISWIHREDIVGLFLLALDNPAARGPINGTAPEPARNVDFSRALAAAIRVGPWPPFLPFGPPDVLLHIVLGEVARVVTTGQRVLPERATALGYAFRYPGLDGALRAVFGGEGPATRAQGA